jgi:hypothetical protein
MWQTQSTHQDIRLRPCKSLDGYSCTTQIGQNWIQSINGTHKTAPQTRDLFQMQATHVRQFHGLFLPNNRLS